MKQKTKRILKMLSIILIILTLFQFVFGSVPSFAFGEMQISEDTIKKIIAEMDEDELKELIAEMDEDTIQKAIDQGWLDGDTIKEVLGEDEFNNLSEKQQESKTDPIDVILGVVDGIVGIFLNIFNIVPVLIGGIIQGMATAVASIGGGRIWLLNDGRYII